MKAKGMERDLDAVSTALPLLDGRTSLEHAGADKGKKQLIAAQVALKVRGVCGHLVPMSARWAHPSASV